MIPALMATIPRPDPLPLPAPPTLIWVLLLLTFLLHLLPMNLVLGGSVIGALSRARHGAGGGEHRRELSRFFAKWLPTTIAAAISLGVAPLLLVQVLYGRLFFSSSVLMAWSWLAVVPLLILGYYGAYLIAFKGEALRAVQGVVAWLSSLTFVAIAFVYTNNMTLMLRPAVFLDKYRLSAAGLHLNLDDPTLFPRFLHMFFGALAVTGLVVALYGWQRSVRDASFGRWAVRHGSLWFAVCTGVNVLLGFWWLIALPRETMLRFMGQNMTATVSLGLGMLFGLGALIMMLLAIQAERPAGLLRGSAVSVLLTLVLMVLARDQVRQGALEAAGFEGVRWIAPQWGALGIFLLLLVAAIVTVIGMTAALARGSGEKAA